MEDGRLARPSKAKLDIKPRILGGAALPALR